MSANPAPPAAFHTLSRLRGMVLGLLTFGLAGSGTELVLLKHYEDTSQLIPLALIAVGLMAIAFHVFARSALSVRVLQVVMLLCLMGGGLGVALHYRGTLAFQLDMDPTAHGWSLFSKIIHAQAPPALAPGVMAQLGLLGLIYGYRHPSLASASRHSSPSTPHSGV